MYSGFVSAEENDSGVAGQGAWEFDMQLTMTGADVSKLTDPAQKLDDFKQKLRLMFATLLAPPACQLVCSELGVVAMLPLGPKCVS